jgi:hypothetical protein
MSLKHSAACATGSWLVETVRTKAKKRYAAWKMGSGLNIKQLCPWPTHRLSQRPVPFLPFPDATHRHLDAAVVNGANLLSQFLQLHPAARTERQAQ